MVYILAQSSDHEANSIQKKLENKNINFVRIEEINISGLKMFLDVCGDLYFEYKFIDSHIIFDNYKINFVILRQFDFNFDVPSEDLNRNQISYIYSDFLVLRNVFLTYLEGFPHFGSLLDEYNRNKLLELQIARKSGFNIPSSFVLNSKSDVENVFQGNQFILKNINRPCIFFEKNYYISTEHVIKCSSENIPKNFTPSFFQEIIRSKNELRIFYYDNKFYPMLIEKDGIENIDWRKDENIVRYSPTKLDSHIISTLRNYIKLANYNSGSFDLMIEDSGDIYFIECNPLGKFDFISNYCSFNIENDIVKKIEEYV